jgi:hypothetical protein
MFNTEAIPTLTATAARKPRRIPMRGSLHNRLYEGMVGNPAPVVGLGVTITMYTDSHAATVVEVSKSGKRILIQKDNAKRTDTNGMSESQSYEYTPNPEAHKQAFTLRADGGWVREGESLRGGQRIVIGFRRAYHDYSF